MEVCNIVLYFTLLVSIAAYTLPDNHPKHSENNSFLGTVASENCRCKNGRCVTDNRGKTKCNCPPGYALQDAFTCEKCNCGTKGRCMFMPQPKSSGGNQYVKKCMCDVGSAEKDGTCIDCHCGENSECEFEGEEKICYCIPGFSERDGVCTECNCGFYGKCKFEFGRKICSCDQGYVEEDGRCTAMCDKLDCGMDAECLFDINSDTPKCTCRMQELVFDESDKKCKEKCSVHRPCLNGASCEKGICYCLPKTRGDFCEIIDECDHLCPKQRDINCTYDTDNRRPFCKCADEKLGYHPDIRQCRPMCDDDSYVCMNGGKCIERERNRFCQCLTGTEGDFCEKVTECQSKECGHEAECRYLIDEGAAFCMCYNRTLSFDSVDKKCKSTCSDSIECENGGFCETAEKYARFCNCPVGTKGDFCQEVIGCISKDCGDHAKCVYDVTKQIAVCVCDEERYAFDPISYKCRRDCQSDAYCKNNGKCKESGDAKFCFCMNGTTGDACEIIEECERNHNKCKGESRCRYNVERREAYCECPDVSKTYDPLNEKCKLACFTDATCHHLGLCMKIGDSSFCRCKIGTSGELCETVDECEKGVCGHSRGVTCQYDVQKETATCGCEDASALYDANTMTCKKRYCVEKTCLNGKCEVIDGSEVCTCFEGYQLDGDNCKELDCRSTPCVNGTCIVRQGNIEECVCPAGFTLNRGTCIRGLCKPETCYGGRCEAIDGELICICPPKFHLEGIGCYETVCEIQRCFGGKCVVEDGKEICTCREGYLLKNDVCKKILCEKKNCFGGQCQIVDDEEECKCPVGYSLFEDVCRIDGGTSSW